MAIKIDLRTITIKDEPTPAEIAVALRTIQENERRILDAINSLGKQNDLTAESILSSLLTNDDTGVSNVS